jgi:hypothetical protein
MEAERQMEGIPRQRAGVEQVRLQTEAQIRRLEEERAELEAAVEARQAGAERLRIEAERQMEVVPRQRVEVEQEHLETEAQIRRFEEERAELEVAVEARQAEAERVRLEAERQISEAGNGSRAEQEQFLLPRADLERITEEAAHDRAEVEASRHKALEEDRRLLEMQQGPEQSRQPSSAELLWLEPEICQQTDIDQLLLEETHLHAQGQQFRDEAQEHYSYAAEELE